MSVTSALGNGIGVRVCWPVPSRVGRRGHPHSLHRCLRWLAAERGRHAQARMHQVKRGRGRACKFFASGRCRDGTACAYSHDLSSAAEEEGGSRSNAAQSSGRSGPGAFRGKRPCRFFAQNGSCRDGQQCPFSHDIQRDDPMVVELLDKDKFRRLARMNNLRREQMVDFLAEAVRCLDQAGSSAEYVVLALGATPEPGDGSGNAREHIKQVLEAWRTAVTQAQAQAGAGVASSTLSQAYLQLLLPVLRIASHDALTSSVQDRAVNTFLSQLKRGLSEQGLKGISQALTHLRSSGWQPSASPSTGPSSWAEVVLPCLLLLRELLERFQAAGQETEQLRDTAGEVLAAARALWEAQGTAPAGGVPARKLVTVLQQVGSLLDHGRSLHSLLVTTAEAQQQRRAAASAAAAQQSLRQQQLRLQDPTYLPGQLREGGPRHDNDHADFRSIQLIPTAAELLCADGPYLPANRPGSIPHLSPELQLLERLFRLMRQDVVAPIADAVQALQQSGGLTRQLKKGTGPSLRLSGDSQLFVFRRVAFEGLAGKEGLHYTVSFEAPPQVEQRSPQDRLAWWKRSRRLTHGTLAVLWAEPEGPRHPVLVLAQVVERDETRLAAMKANTRPTLGLRLCLGSARKEHAASVTTLLAAGSAGHEVVLLQENNSFFAYQPILSALQAQAGRPLPLVQYLVPPPPAAAAGRGDCSGPAGAG